MPSHLRGSTVTTVMHVTALGDVAARDRASNEVLLRWSDLSARGCALLIWLAVSPPGRHRRELVAGDLVGGEHSKPRAALRGALDDLRKALKGAGVDPDRALPPSSRQNMELSRDVVSVDYDEYRQRRNGTTSVDLGRAFELGKDGFPRGLGEHAVHAPPDEDSRERRAIAWGVDWLAGRRTQHEDELLQLCRQLMNLAREDDDLAAATRWASELSRLDPLSVDVEADFIQCLVASGQPDEARSEIRRFEGRLREAQRSTDRIKELRNLIEHPPAAARPRQQTAIPEVLARMDEELIVGRAAELERIEKAWFAAKTQSRGLVLVPAPPGIGKSRLMAAAAGRLHRAGADILYGQAGGGGYEPLAAALSEFFKAQPDRVQQSHLGASPPELLRVLPWLPKRFQVLGQALAINPAGQRRRLFSAIDEVLARTSKARPIVLLLDDLHEATVDALDLLKYLMADETRGLLIVCAYRPPNAGDFAGELRALIADCDPVVVPLGPLDATDTRELAASHTGRELNDTEANRIWRHSRGVPHGVLLAADQWIAERRSRRGTLTPAWLKTLKDVRLWPLVTMLPAVPERISADILEEASGIAAPDIASILKPLVDRKLLDVSDDGYRYRHDLDREAVEEAARARLNTEVRAGIYGKLATALSTQAEPNARQLARLFGASLNAEQARIWSSRAGREAARALTLHQASVEYRQALKDATGEERCHILLELGASLWDTGEFADARQVYAEAADIADEHGLAEALADAALGFAGRLAFQGASADGALVALLGRALSKIGTSDEERKATLMATLAQARIFVGTRDASARLDETPAELSKRAIALAKNLGDSVYSDVLCRTCWALWTPDNLDEMIELADNMVRLAKHTDQRPALVLESLFFRVAVQIAKGHSALAREDIAACETLADELHQSHYTALVKMILAMLGLLEGPGCEDLSREALDTGGREQHPTIMQLFAGQILHIRWLQGRTPELQAASRDLTDYYQYLPVWRAGRALIYADSDRTDEAADDVKHLIADDFAVAPRDLFWIVLMDHTCRVYTALARQAPRSANDGFWPFGDEDLPKTLYDKLLPHADQFVVVGGAMGIYGTVSHALGLMAACMANLEDARRHFSDAARAAAEFGAQPAAAEARIELANVLAECGSRADLPEIAELLEHVIEQAERFDLGGTALRSLRPAALAQSLAEAAMETELAQRIEVVYNRAYQLWHPPTAPDPSLSQRAARTVAIHGSAGLRRLIRNRDDAQLDTVFARKAVHSGVFTSMARLYQPQFSFGFVGEVQFEIERLDGLDVITWTVAVRREEATARPGPSHDADVTLTMKAPTFVRLFAQELNGVKAWVEGDLRIQGDPTLAARLIEMFGGIAPFAGALNAPTDEVYSAA